MGQTKQGDSGSSSGPKTEDVDLKKSDKKKETVQEARKEKSAMANREPKSEEAEKVKTSQSSSTPWKQQKGGKLKKVDLCTKPEVILDTFQNRDSADQVLMREAQKVADELRGKNHPAGERNEQFDHPTGASDYSSVKDTGVRRSSRQAPNSKEPQRFGTPVKHSI